MLVHFLEYKCPFKQVLSDAGSSDARGGEYLIAPYPQKGLLQVVRAALPKCRRGVGRSNLLLRSCLSEVDQGGGILPNHL
ncbi:hypothetical protein CEXT_312781 [Caerostris extrusa]|uniref:Uncharacterized protein n=1 Tax=Caerostris extrusa TaxID=172846 RepID=A0AAV4R964_CAEEX|nr:hypothetical protein CEXT_312781 [Caerostris extrusa]